MHVQVFNFFLSSLIEFKFELLLGFLLAEWAAISRTGDSITVGLNACDVRRLRLCDGR